MSENKHGNKTCHCYQRHWHASIAEANHCNLLRERQRKREFYIYVYQRKYKLYAHTPGIVQGIHVADHYPDFTLLDRKGNVIAIEEVKGFADKVWPMKKKMFEANYPHIPYRVIKYKPERKKWTDKAIKKTKHPPWLRPASRIKKKRLSG